MRPPAWLTARPVAHRGLHDVALGVSENTLSAAQRAAHFDFAIECDVQLSADGEAVVFHDFTLERLTTKHGRVDGVNAQELATLSIQGSHDCIVTLATYLDLIHERVPVFIEIKSRFDGDLRLARRVAEIVGNRRGRIALMSFDPDVIMVLGELAPFHARGIVAESTYNHEEWINLSDQQRRELMHFLHLDRSRPDFIAWHIKDFPHATPIALRYLGMPILTWTVRKPDEQQIASRFAHQIIFENLPPESFSKNSK